MKSHRVRWGSTVLLALVALMHYVMWLGWERYGLRYSRDKALSEALSARVLSREEADALLDKDGTVVESAAPESRDSPWKGSKYLSDKTRRTIKETVRREGMVGGVHEESVLSGTGILTRNPSFMGEGPGIEKSEGTPASLGGASVDFLASDVVEGAETQLNTDEYRFASLFNRLKDELAPRWIPKVHAIVREKWRILPAGLYRTEVSLGTDDTGAVTAVEVIKSSGYDDLDRVAIQAIWDMKKVNNLPAELLNRKGLYRTNFSFLLQLNKTGFDFKSWIEEDQRKRWSQNDYQNP